MTDNELLQLHRRGLSQRDVADRLGVSQRCVCYGLKRLGAQANGYDTEASKRKRSASTVDVWRVRRLESFRTRKVEVLFPVLSNPPSDGYKLFSALCRSGFPFHDDREFHLMPTPAGVLIRLPEFRVAELLSVRLRPVIDGRPLILGQPQLRTIAPAGSLFSSLAIIAGKMDDQSFRSACKEQLDAMAVDCRVELTGRGVLRVRKHTIVGYGVRLSGLSTDGSLTVQYAGVGGRQRFGCGVFRPC